MYFNQENALTKNKLTDIFLEYPSLVFTKIYLYKILNPAVLVKELVEISDWFLSYFLMKRHLCGYKG